MRGGEKNQRKGRKRPCYKCGKVGHVIAECPNNKEDKGKKEQKKEKFKRGEKSKGDYKKKRYGQAHVGEEWNSGDESSSSEDEGVASIAIQKPSSTSRLFTNLSDNEDDYTSTCLMAKGVKVTLPNQSHSDDDDESSLRNKMIKEFGINGYNIITKLMEKLEKKKMTLEAQENLLILEKERNLELQKSIDDKDEEIKNLTRKLLLVNSTMEEKEVELSKATNSIVDLRSANELLQSNISSLRVPYQELEVKFDTL